MAEPEQKETIVGMNAGLLSGAHRFSREAMATTFEVIIAHPDANYAAQGAQAAFTELERLEGELSRFVENSDIARINNLAPNEELSVGLETFECLQRCAQLYKATYGAFDITIGSLMDCWLKEDKTARTPSEEELNLARRRTGMGLVKLNKSDYTVGVLVEGVRIDFGGFGKGYAVDRMAELLRDWSIDTALVHGGYSSVLAVGAPGEKESWPVTLSSPTKRSNILGYVHLKDSALSGSGLEQGSHIIDPRNAKPVKHKLAAWAGASDAATADALSTAFMVMSAEEIEEYCLAHVNTLAVVVVEGESGDEKVLHFGDGKGAEFLKQ